MTNARHEIVLVLTPEFIERSRRRIRLRKMQIAAAEFETKQRSREAGIIDLGIVDDPAMAEVRNGK